MKSVLLANKHASFSKHSMYIKTYTFYALKSANDACVFANKTDFIKWKRKCSFCEIF